MATAKQTKGSEFHVVMGDIKLPAAAEKRIEAQIQQIVLAELAGYTPNPDDPNPQPWPWRWRNPLGPVIVIPPIRWPGFIILKDLKDIKQIEEIRTRF